MGVSHLLLLGPFYTIQTIPWANILHPSVPTYLIKFRYYEKVIKFEKIPNLVLKLLLLNVKIKWEVFMVSSEYLNFT